MCVLGKATVNDYRLPLDIHILNESLDVCTVCGVQKRERERETGREFGAEREEIKIFGQVKRIQM